ncbi:helix-turn-helix domain-containing protein [Pseudomonas argentinensis]|uniref:Cytoskeleton protein RodZ n=1 Tax=Phytopseudomonas argentinensis TaxID=289370 RepID=A0A1I3HBR0_9GAMM|nr:RodZ family helix-turn-helix domain-containing protein [Pseudomonas argentinensis]KAB0548524.1 helix-turn-helix domain-containing protein [Pseudomonas argentinensis]SFI33069.1 cytoskeleton protein RodZ [Pseudomonas argentinensis]
MKAAQPEVAAAHRVNPGEALRAARESRGWSVAEVATQLNLTPMRLSQLEAGEFDKLPGNTFSRGYIRAYAKLLGLEQAPLVADFDQFTGSNATGSSVHALGRIEEPTRYSQSILRLVSFLLLVGVGSACFYWWQDQGWQIDDLKNVGLGHVEVDGADGSTQIHPLDEPEDQAVAEAQSQGTELPLPGVAAEQPEGTAPEATASELLEQNPPAQAAPVEPAPAPTEPSAPNAPAAPAAQAPASPAAQPQAPVAAGEGLVSLKFTADCWVQVTDANGKVIASGLKRAGDSLDARGKAPMELRLGFARGAQVTYNGAAVDVTPHISGETARLKLGGQ